MLRDVRFRGPIYRAAWFKFHRQNSGIYRQLGDNFLGESRAKVGCKVRDGTECGGYLHADGQFERDIREIGDNNGTLISIRYALYNRLDEKRLTGCSIVPERGGKYQDAKFRHF